VVGELIALSGELYVGGAQPSNSKKTASPPASEGAVLLLLLGCLGGGECFCITVFDEVMA
jgi:hypothetical protein